MKMSTPIVVGLGAVLILIVIVIIVASSGDEEETDEVSDETEMDYTIADEDLGGSFNLGSGEYPDNEVYEEEEENSIDEHEQHMIQQQDHNPPLCDVFDGCPDDQEVRTGVYGDSAALCCQHPECPSDICQASEFKKPAPGGRGTTVDQCCVDALCDVSMCNENEFLKPGADKGFNSSDCCQEKPLCSASFTCSGEYEEKAGPPIPRGETRDECCDLKLCSLNGFDDEMCGNVGMKAKTGGVRGKSVEECCEMDTCKANMDRNDDDAHPFKWENDGQCPSGTSFEFLSDDQLGNRLSDCCTMASCEDNGWDDSECKFESGNKKTLKYGDPRGDTVDQCCDEKLCENNYYFDTRSTCIDGGPAGSPSEPGMSSPCYHMGNTNQEYQSLPEVDIAGEDRRRPNTHMGGMGYGDMKKNCAYFNMKLAPRGTKMPFDTTKNTETCCQALTCKEYSENPESGITTECDANAEGKPGVFLEDKIIPVSELDVDPNTLIYKPAQDQCCEAAKCSEVYSDQKCVDNFDAMQEKGGQDFTHPFTVGSEEYNIASGSYLKYNSINESEPSSINTCCKPKKCSEVDYVCPDDMVKKATQPTSIVSDENCCEPKTCANSAFSCPAGQPNISPAPNKEATTANCCEPVRCDDARVGWTDAKCKDKTFTRAAYRGKMKKDPRDPSKAMPIENMSISQATPGTAPPSTTAAGSPAGDSQCCEQSKDNFARQCVGEMWKDNRLENGSVGADTGQHLVQIGSRRTATSPDACKNLCVADANCTAFRLTAHTTNKNQGGTTSSPNCDLFRAFSANDAANVQYKVAGEFSASPAHTHYVSNETFPESIRYTGGPLQTIANVKDPEHSPSKPGHENKAVWAGKEKVYLAGVDKEFCPYRYVKGYGVLNDGSHGANYYGGTWHDREAPQGDPFGGRDTEYISRKAGKLNNTKGGGCYGSTHYALNDTAHPIYAGQALKHINHTTHTPFYPSEALDACYTEDDCHWAWLNPHGHMTGTNDSGLGYQTRWDPATAYVYNYSAKSTDSKRCTIEQPGGPVGLRGNNVKRRVCMKGQPNKVTSNVEPHYHSAGGASMFMTRNKVGTSGAAKYRVGTMPYKTKFKDHHWYSGPKNWGGLLISGDDSSELPSF